MNMDQDDGLFASRTRYRRGMVVGKFCPLHLGHMHLIQTALDACDEVRVMSYTKPEFKGLGRTRREAWLRELYPGVRSLVIDDASLGDLCASRGLPRHTLPHNDEDAAVHREFTAWLCEAICETTVDAVFTSEDYGDGLP
jgi:HTH-type transcriptional regulator, transcriptional repressor of NAD biosynthesis genes